METKIKWTKTYDSDECRCYEPSVKDLMFIWWYGWYSYERYTVGDGRERKCFKTLKEAKEYVSSLVK